MTQIQMLFINYEQTLCSFFKTRNHTLFLIPALRIHCSCQCKKMLDELGGYQLEERGLVSMKVGNRVLTTNLAMQLIAVEGN